MSLAQGDMRNMKKVQNDRVLIFDTTLRDGEQCPGASLNQREKIEIAQQLARLNVDVIEAGFPIASPADLKAVQAVADQVKGPQIAGLARSLEKDIVRCAEAIAPAGSVGVSMYFWQLPAFIANLSCARISVKLFAWPWNLWLMPASCART